LDAYLKLPYRNYSDKYLEWAKADEAKQQTGDKKLRDSVALNPVPALPVTTYLGKYSNALYGHLTITQGSNNDLEIRFEHHPRMYAHMQPLGGNRFYVTFSDPVYGKAVFPFTIKNGQVTSLRVKVADFVERDAYEFKKD
jgi:Domain of unknown function (DUF3471)